MIKVNIKKSNNIINEIICTGHAMHDIHGKDIVCSAFSTMVITTINGILEIDKDAISYEEKNGVKIKNIKKDEITNKLLNNLLSLMYELRDSYSKNINIKEENHE